MNKRKDNRGRNLFVGEIQKPDGSYRYRYLGLDGVKHDVYSWRLTASDETPAGKQDRPPLRELEKQIQKDLEDGIVTAQGKTLNQMFESLMGMKFGVRESTCIGYRDLYDRYIKTEYGNRDIEKFKKSDIKSMYVKLKTSKELSGGTIRKIHCLLSQAFDMAVDDDLLRKNPCEGGMHELNTTKEFKPRKRTALTAQQQKELLTFVKNSIQYKHWYPLIAFMLGTGTRVGEATGLYWKNVDLRNRLIHIDHSLNSVGTQFKVSDTKTASGIRDIPMLKGVEEALLELRNQAPDAKGDDFVFLNEHGHFVNRNWLNQMLKRIVKEYNEKQEDASKLLPEDISSHVLRHSFITRMCENDVNAKVTQVIAGHSKISTTLDIYTDVFEGQKKKVFEELDKLDVV